LKNIQKALFRFVRKRVRAAKPGRLELLMRGGLRRVAVLGAIFWAMPRAVTRKSLEREKRLIIEWRISGRKDGRQDIRQLVIEDGAAVVVEGEPRDSDLAILMDGATFLRVVTANANPAELFAKGQVQIWGDPTVGLRLGKVFGRR
jgi:hypothetical protein